MITRTGMMNKLSGLILVFQVLYCSCQTTLLRPVDPEVIEGNNITFVCTLSATATFVNWDFYNATNKTTSTTAMGVQSSTCALSPFTSFLSNKAKYSYDCNSTVYQVTVKNIQRYQHNDVWSCTPYNQTHRLNSTIKVQGPVKYVALETTEATVTVEEGTLIALTCKTSGARPKATVAWYKIESGKTSWISQNITSSTTDDDFSVTTSTLRFVPTRQQQGVKIYCNAANNLTILEIRSELVEMNVSFRPRSADTVEENKRSEIDASITFTFNAVANPKPIFTWKKWDTDQNQWNNLRNGGDIVIKSSVLQSNLTIQKVTQKCFTKYKLEIRNSVGNMTQIYELSPYEKPVTPVGFHFVEDLTTATSIHLEWKPGFNGGLPQTFHIKYKKSTIKTWNNINISDTGEAVMSYTLTGLTPKTQYHIIIYASNKKGQSEESYVRSVHTKGEPASLGPLIGGIVGGIAVLVIFIIGGIIIWRRYPICKEKKENKTSTRRQAAVSRSPESGSDDDEMIENQLYEKSDPTYAQPIKSKDQNGARDADHKPNDKEIGGYVYAEVDKKKKIQPKEKRQKQIDGDLYAEVDKKKKKQSNEKRQKGKVNKKVEDTYENSNIVTNEGQKSKIVNQDGLEYIDLVFNKSPGEKIIKTISGDESVPYDAVDFTKKAEPLP